MPEMRGRVERAEAGSRAAREPPHAGRGLGLGLAITKHIVEVHDGTISVESDGPMRGARFDLKFPIVRDVASLLPREPRLRVG